MILLIFAVFTFIYLIGLFVTYKITNQKMNKLNLQPSPEEAGMLLRLIALYPLFYPEIEVFLKTCNKKQL